MKKFLALFLVMVTTLTIVLVSCKKDPVGNKDTDDDDDNGNGLIGKQTTSVTNDTSTGTGSSNLQWNDVNETVYVINCSELNVRKGAGTSYESVGTIKFGQSFRRIKYNADWSVIEYNNGEYYVGTKFLTTSANAVTFEDIEEKTVYANVEKTLNLRWYPVEDTYLADSNNSINTNSQATSVKRGAALVQTGISKDGLWARVKFTINDKEETVYCKVKYLSDEEPSTDTSGTSGGSSGPGVAG